MTTPDINETITLTPSAAQVVRDLRQKQNLGEDFCLRIYIAGQTCSGFQYGMALDNQLHEKDARMETEGISILVDENSFALMLGSVVDFIDDERGRGFLVSNPNKTPSCSCESGTCC
jgi:iron-sulfur cluster assembly accessory protein